MSDQAVTTRIVAIPPTFPTIAEAAWDAGLVTLALWLLPVAILLPVQGPGNVFADIAVFFSKMAVADLRRGLCGPGLGYPGGSRHL